MREKRPPHLRHIKRNFDMTHGTKVIYFIRLHVSNDRDEISGITKVAIVKKELHASLVTVTVNVINASGVEGRTTSDDTMNLLTQWSKRRIYQ